MIITKCPVCNKKNRIRSYDSKVRPICAICRAPLINNKDNSHNLSLYCVLCGESSKSLENLSNGAVYHQECYLNLIRENKGTDSQISAIDNRIQQLKLQLIEASSLIQKVKGWFFQKTIDVESIKEKIAIEENHIHELSSNNERLTGIIFDLHTYWLTYPPDWEERRSMVASEGDYCDECGSCDGPLHIHHIIPISKGGNHSIHNLALLCEECHGKIHGGKEFSYSDAEKIGAFGKRVKLLQNAIENQKIVHFQYKKYEGQKSVRSIRPEGLRQVGESLCVHGYCYLRDDVRVFAIKRMKGAKIIHAPGKCFDI